MLIERTAATIKRFGLTKLEAPIFYNCSTGSDGMKRIKLILINILFAVIGFTIFSALAVCGIFFVKAAIIFNPFVLVCGIVGACVFEFFYFSFLKGILKSKKQ